METERKNPSGDGILLSKGYKNERGKKNRTLSLKRALGCNGKV